MTVYHKFLRVVFSQNTDAWVTFLEIMIEKYWTEFSTPRSKAEQTALPSHPQAGMCTYWQLPKLQVVLRGNGLLLALWIQLYWGMAYLTVPVITHFSIFHEKSTELIVLRNYIVIVFHNYHWSLLIIANIYIYLALMPVCLLIWLFSHMALFHMHI